MGLTDLRQRAKNITNYRQNGKKITDYRQEKYYRHGPTLSIFFFSEGRVYCIFSTFLGSN